MRLLGDVGNPELGFVETEKGWRNGKKAKRSSLSAHSTCTQRTHEKLRNKGMGGTTGDSGGGGGVMLRTGISGGAVVPHSTQMGNQASSSST